MSWLRRRRHIEYFVKREGESWGEKNIRKEQRGKGHFAPDQRRDRKICGQLRGFRKCRIDDNIERFSKPAGCERGRKKREEKHKDPH